MKKNEQRRQRYGALDWIRGITLISMILYHGAWDLVYMFGVNWDWYRSKGAYAWQQSICWTFILLSGFCWALGQNRRRKLRRGLLVFSGGALITAALEMGWAVAGGTEEQREALRRYGAALGLAFQIQDDILDVVGDEAALGKPIGSDARSGKTTFVTLKGVDGCRALVARLTEQAAEALASFGGEGTELRALAESLADRQT